MEEMYYINSLRILVGAILVIFMQAGFILLRGAFPQKWIARIWG